MAATKRGISPDLVIHPGETIADVLAERRMTQKELADRAGTTEAFLSGVIQGKKNISKKLAMGLEYALNVPSSFWLNLQANYEAELLSLREADTVREEEIKLLPKLKEIVSALRTRRKLTHRMTAIDQVIGLRNFLQISNLADLPSLVPDGAFRLSQKAAVDPHILGAWLSLCRAQSAGRQLDGVFDPRQSGHLIAQLKDLMCSEPDNLHEALVSLLASYGIDFSLLRTFRGAPVHGYIARKGENTYQMTLTVRGKFADIFWFSLFHELGHLVNGDVSSSMGYIDSADPSDITREQEADLFASNSLLDAAGYAAFLASETYSLSAIRTFAETQHVPPYIVIGRLQRDKIIPYNRFAAEKLRYKWADA